MPEIKKEFQNADTKARYRMTTNNWNRTVHIPGVWKGLIQNIPPNAVEEYIKMGRKDIVPIDPAKENIQVDPAGQKPPKPPKPEAQ